MRHPLIAALSIAAAVHVGAAQTPTSTKPAEQTKLANAYRYRLLGVYDEQSGDPVEGVEVSDVMSGNKSLTTSTGTVSLLFLPEGVSMIRLRKVGFGVQTLTVSISPADTTPITVIIQRATSLPTVVVNDTAKKHISPALQGFEERRKVGIGHFITDSLLRKDEGRPLGNVITAHIPGVTLVPGRGGAYFLVTTKQCAMAKAGSGAPCSRAPCFVRVYQDGLQIYDGNPANRMTNGVDLAHLSTDTWGAVEFYSGGAETPPQYNSTGGDCGTLLLWTRER